MKRRMGPTHHLLPNVRFTELRSREGKSTVRIDRKPLIKLKAHLRVCLFFVWIFILLRELMSKAVDVEGVTYIISINYRALKHIFFSWIWYT